MKSLTRSASRTMSSSSCLAGPAEGDDVFFGHQRVAQLVVLVGKLDNRTGQWCAFFHRPGASASVPAAKLRTMTSSGMISTWRINCSRMFRRRMKCVGIADLPEPVMKMLAQAVVQTRPCLRSRPFFCALKAVASSLKYWTSVPGSGPSYRILLCLRRPSCGVPCDLPSAADPHAGARHMRVLAQAPLAASPGMGISKGNLSANRGQPNVHFRRPRKRIRGQIRP